MSSINDLNLNNLRISQDFSESIGVKKAIHTIPIKRPPKQDFIQTSPDPAYQIPVAVIELKEDRETYLVAPELASELCTEVIPKLLVTTINRQGVLFLWPIKLPDHDGRIDSWNESAMNAANLAKDRWVRVSANMSLGGYDVFEATGNLSEPDWPDLAFEDIIRIAFKNKFIDDINHPVLQRLRGES